MRGIPRARRKEAPVALKKRKRADRVCVAIDGTASSGKSSVSRKLAHRLEGLHVNSGLMYRAIGWKAIEKGVDLDDETKLGIILETTTFSYSKQKNGGTLFLLDGTAFPVELESEEVAHAASVVAQYAEVRIPITSYQCKLVRTEPVIVIEGRDAGSIIAPDADLKVFIDAPLGVRAGRRTRQLVSKGFENPDVELIKQALRERDRRDSGRALAPMKYVSGALKIDNSDLRPAEQVKMIMDRLEG